MNLRIVFLWVLWAALSHSLHDRAAAQTFTRYNSAPSSRPVVSPYLNLLRPSSPDLPNYQTLVQPQLNQMRINRQQSSELQRAQHQLRTAQSRSNEVPLGPFRPTGYATRYLNYSHFYGTSGGAGGRP